MCISIFIDLGANFNLATFGQGEGYAPSHSPSPLSNKCRLPRGKPALVAQGGGGMGGGICLFYSHRTMHLSPSPVGPFWLAHAGAGLASRLAVLNLCTGLSTGCTDLL